MMNSNNNNNPAHLTKSLDQLIAEMKPSSSQK